MSEVKLLLCFVLFFLATSNVSSEKVTTDVRSSKCILPPRPQNGNYQVVSELVAEPGEALDSVVLIVTCNSGYVRYGKTIVHCVLGHWSTKMPECMPTMSTPSVISGKQSVVNFNSESSSILMAKASKADGCILPPQPEHGTYVSNVPNATGQESDVLIVDVICEQGYGVIGSAKAFCFNGIWTDIPKCVRVCQLKPDSSFEYYCQIEDQFSRGTRVCNEFVASGSIVIPKCSDHYHYSTVAIMQCLNGTWDHVAVCKPECGVVASFQTSLVISGGFAAHRGELPWQAGIYTKNTKPYRQICGGSLITAHCFWNNAKNKQFPSDEYAVAMGKVFRPWNNLMDEDQKSDVKEIKIPVRYQGITTSYQDDIAVVIVVTPFEYKLHVRPVCITFDNEFEKHQLIQGTIGKVAGWGLTGENAPASQVLMVADLPYIDIEQCMTSFSRDFLRYITSDKICAGYTNGSALCKGDSGGGLAFPVTERGTKRYYLHGIASTAPNNGNLCNLYTYTSFTHLIRHEHFIKQYFNDF